MNKVVLVTGSSKGIGRAIIKEFSKNGYDVVINYNTSYLEAKTLEEEIKTYNVKVLLIKCDVGVESEVKEMFDKVIKEMGRIDVVINNAGIAIDTMFIDNIVPAFPGIDYSNMCDGTMGLYGKTKIRKVCPCVFYTLYILPNGDVVTCCDPPYPIVLGNIKNESLIDMWNGKRRKEFLRMQLQGNRHKHPVCQRCIQPNITDFKEDDLDEVAEILLKKI